MIHMGKRICVCQYVQRPQLIAAHLVSIAMIVDNDRYAKVLEDCLARVQVGNWAHSYEILNNHLIFRC